MRKNVLTKDMFLSREIEYLIENEYREGQALPPERDMAASFDVQRDTLRSALDLLEQKGIILKRERIGNFVAPSRVRFDLNKYRSTKRYIEGVGKKHKVILLTFEKISIDRRHDEDYLLPEGTLVYRIMRLRYANDIPMALERSHVLCEMASGLNEEDVHKKSIYSTLKNKFNITIANSKQKVTVIKANGLESELLKIERDEPVMRYEGIVYDSKGRIVEFFDNTILMDSVEFVSQSFV
ncbi:GntR family transcriptional regulator [Candidatus Micrarchaeota archaeon]|nr:GntR family transcriptional regulator [Candidatus Micrarchaeota archaeon]